MNFLDKVAKFNWAPNETWKIEQELKAAKCFVPEGPPIEQGTTSFADLFCKRNRSATVDIPIPNPKRYIPGKVFFPKDVDSFLTKREQAICLKVLQFYQSGSDCHAVTAAQQENIKIFQSLQSKIQEENSKFLKYVEEDWAKRRNRMQKVRLNLQTYARSLWKKKLLRSLAYPQFYKCHSLIPLLDTPPVEVGRVEEVLQMGAVAEFSPPSLLLKFAPKVSSLPDQEGAYTYNSKLPVSQDNHIENLLLNRDVDIVISASVVKLFMDNSDYNIGWDVPIVIKQHKIKQADGSFVNKNIVYFDKPLPKRNPSNSDFNELCHKRLVRTNFCIFPKVVYPNSETLRENPYYTGNSVDSNEPEPSLLPPLFNRTIQHNVSYDIWSVKLKDEENQLMKTKASGRAIKFLMRCKLDACELLSNGEMRPLVIVPKLEYQTEHGANIATKSELIRQWTSLFFRPFSHLYRVRMQANSSEVLSVESVSLQKINTEAVTHYSDKPHQRLGALYKIFSELIKLDPGNYLLHHSPKRGPFADVLKAKNSDFEPAEGSESKTFNLHSEYNSSNCKVVPASNKWCPIDVHYILPVHAVYKRMPGMFKPLLATKKKKKGKKGLAVKTKNQGKNVSAAKTKNQGKNVLAAKTKNQRKKAAKRKRNSAKNAQKNEA